MKLFIYILSLLFSASIVSAQSWQDSLQKGKAYYKEGNYKRSYETLLEAQKLAPSDVNLSQDIGNAAYRNGDYEMARKAFQSAASNENDKSAQAKQWHNVGNSQMKEKNYQDAIESYKNALHINPNDEKTRYNLAEAKRRVKLQKEKQQKKQQQQNQKNQDQNKKEKQQKQGNKDGQKKESQKQQQKQNQQQGNKKNENSIQENPEGKLSDRKSDRILKDLLKEEMKTKRKVRGAESSNKQQNSNSGKRW